MLPDALKTRCGSCTKIQKAKSLDVITRLYYQHPSLYTALAERYDPSGEYTKNFENWFDQQNIVKPPQRNDGNQFVARNNAQSTTRSVPQETRRSPNLVSVQRNPNEVPTERTRIPSTWITSSTTTATRRPITTPRAPLRTSPVTPRPTPPREEPPVVFRELAPAFRASVTQPQTTVRPSPVTFRETPAPTRASTRAPTESPAFIEPALRFQARDEFIEPANRVQAPPVFLSPPRTEPAAIPKTQPNIFTQPATERTQAPFVFRELTTLRPSTVRTTTTSLPIVFREPVTEAPVFRAPVEREQIPFIQAPPTVVRPPPPPPPPPASNPSTSQRDQLPEIIRAQPAVRVQPSPTQAPTSLARDEPVFREPDVTRRPQARAPSFQSVSLVCLDVNSFGIKKLTHTFLVLFINLTARFD